MLGANPPRCRHAVPMMLPYSLLLPQRCFAPKSAPPPGCLLEHAPAGYHIFIFRKIARPSCRRLLYAEALSAMNPFRMDLVGIASSIHVDNRHCPIATKYACGKSHPDDGSGKVKSAGHVEKQRQIGRGGARELPRRSSMYTYEVCTTRVRRGGQRYNISTSTVLGMV